MAAEFSGMMPRLYGAPAYTAPRRHPADSQRPFDPDDLPLESYRSASREPAVDDEPLSFDADGMDDWLARATRAPFGLTRR